MAFIHEGSPNQRKRGKWRVLQNFPSLTLTFDLGLLLLLPYLKKIYFSIIFVKLKLLCFNLFHRDLSSFAHSVASLMTLNFQGHCQILLPSQAVTALGVEKGGGDSGAH